MSRYRKDKEDIYLPNSNSAVDFSYSDGDEVEQRILAQLKTADDIGLASDELQNLVEDWPSEYHFSSIRPNLLSHLHLNRFPRILEIGSGCGAMTRLLGEKGNDVLALEGSYRRAQMTRSRCRDLDNVSVYCDSFDLFESDETYSLATMIGVLEYSPVFFKDGNPIQAALSKAYHLLDENGVLVVAIENQLGLKYFNACGEDHTGELFKGINDAYVQGDAITFGRKELQKTIEKAGFNHLEFIYPFPDYKLPRLLVREPALHHNGINPGKLIGQYVSRDYFNHDQRLFLENKIWSVIERNELVADLSNSFLVFAFKGSQNLANFTDPWIVKSFSSVRKKKYLTTNTFREDKGSLIVEKESLYPAQISDVNGLQDKILTHHTGPATYIHGDPYGQTMPNGLFHGDSFQDYVDYLNPWIQYLQDNQIKSGQSNDKETSLLPGGFLDCRPDNLIVDTRGNLEYFDREWEYKKPLALDFVIFRGVLHDLLGNIYWYRKADLFGNKTPREWMEKLFAVLGQMDVNTHFDQYLEYEIGVQSEVTLAGEDQLRQAMMGFLKNEVARIPSVEELLNSERLLKDAKVKIDALEAHNRELEAHNRELNKGLLSFEQQNRELAAQLNSTTQMIHDIWAGWSWRIGRAVTYVPRKVKLAFNQIAKKFPISIYKHKALRGNETDFYQVWFKKYMKLKGADRDKIKVKIERLSEKPLISIIMPTYNSSGKWLCKAIESVKNQLYPNWELCIADDASTEPEVKEILKGYEKSDQRIKVVYRNENGHISAASNSALELATGEFVALMDHDDELTEDALFFVVNEINQYPDAALIYSDEDKINEKNALEAPYFKPDWNPDLYLSYNYFCHLVVFRRSIVLQIGGFRIGFEGAQDWDLGLRVIEKISQNQIRHIPRVLYHWRIMPGSTSLDVDEKTYAVEAGEKSLKEALERRHISAKSFYDAEKVAFRVRYPLKREPFVSLIILTRDGLQVLEKCVSSILSKTEYSNYEVIIVDNDSQEQKTLDYFKMLEETESRVKIQKDKRAFNFSSLNNEAVKNSDGDIIGLVNNDIEVIDGGWLREMVSHAVRPEVGAVGARLLYPNDTLQHGGVVTGLGGIAGHAFKMLPRNDPGLNRRATVVQNYSAVTAACVVIRREVYNEVEGLDEKNLAVAFNDIDFCLRIREAGYLNVYTPYAELYHHESYSRGYEDTKEKQARFSGEIQYMRIKWGVKLENDPYYNLNLTLDREDFSLADPPRTVLPWEV